GFAAAGKVKPVGELVKPGSADGDSDKEAVGQKDSGGGKGEVGGSAGTDQAGLGDKASGSSGKGIAVAITGGALLLLAAAVFLVNRKWP
ncbi:D-alanyl-D-alanine carboxypeptidase, partial [Streptomyces niveus]